MDAKEGFNRSPENSPGSNERRTCRAVGLAEADNADFGLGSDLVGEQ
jgi:hypothetical protein